MDDRCDTSVDWYRNRSAALPVDVVVSGHDYSLVVINPSA